MQTFISDVSKKEYPLREKVSGALVRDGVLKEIQRTCPWFNSDSLLSATELNQFRQQYVQNLMSREIGTLSELEQTVLKKISDNHLVADATDIKRDTLTRGQRWADRIATFGGSWRFISMFMLFLFLWIILNIFFLRSKSFDPFPFILLNLILSCIAAIQAPIIMMSQNRQEEKDRERAKNDYMVNLKSELEIRMLHEKIDHLIITQQQNLLEIQQIQVDMMKELMEKTGHSPKKNP